MKKIILSLITITLFSAVNAQNTSMLDTMSRENIKLLTRSLVVDIHTLENQIKSIDSCHYNHEKYLFSEALNNDTICSIKSPWDFMDFNFLSAEGDRDRQTVTVTLLLTNTGLHQKLYLDYYRCEAIDAIGNSYLNEKIKVSSGNHTGTAYTNTPIRIELIFKGVMPGTEKFNLIPLHMSSTDASSRGASQKELVEIRNVKIDW